MDLVLACDESDGRGDGGGGGGQEERIIKTHSFHGSTYRDAIRDEQTGMQVNQAHDEPVIEQSTQRNRSRFFQLPYDRGTRGDVDGWQRWW